MAAGHLASRQAHDQLLESEIVADHHVVDLFEVADEVEERGGHGEPTVTVGADLSRDVRADGAQRNVLAAADGRDDASAAVGKDGDLFLRKAKAERLSRGVTYPERPGHQILAVGRWC